MTGIVAQIIALTAFGNDFLNNGKVPADFNSKNTTFEYCNKVDFREFKKQFFFSKVKEMVAAENPTKWFEYLKADGCKHLRLYFEYSKDQGIAKDHQLAGFVGGGGLWLIEAVYDNCSNYWLNRWEGTDPNAPDNKIWSVNYGMTAVKQPTINLQIDNDEIKIELRRSLTEITNFAIGQNLNYWVEQFEKAKSFLDSRLPEENFYQKDLIPVENYSLTAKQILFSAASSWVFGGMGTWNDLVFDRDEDQAEYDRLSAQLYSNINKAIVAAINTY